MQEITLDELVSLARDNADKSWHFHYLTPDCVFNQSNQNQVILELSDKAYFTTSPDKPLAHLKILEELFYKK